MKFTMWTSMTLVGVGVLFARDGNANDATTHESLGRRRIERTDSGVNSSTLERRLRDDNDNNIENSRIHPQGQGGHPLSSFVEDESSSSSGIPTRSARSLLAWEDAWFHTMLLNTVDSFSLMPLPTDPPNQETEPTDAPTVAPSIFRPVTADPTTSKPTNMPTKRPTKLPATPDPTKTPTSSPTRPPTKTPTSNPTVPPTEAPTVPPTTIAPTRRPTIAPTDRPTIAPSPGPTTLEPTVSPTMAPTVPGPTLAPTEACEVQVEISCVWAVDGVTDCRNIPIPGACSADGIDLSLVQQPVPLSSISMLFDYSPCSGSLTLQEQPEEFICVDEGQPSSTTDFQAQIACFDDDMNVLVDSTYTSGEFVLLVGQNEDGNLGDSIRCEISEMTPTGIQRLQEMRITTSVLGNFYLSDRYGSFVIESCDTLRCVEPVLYTYNITNIQNEPRRITELLRDRNDDVVSLLPLLSEEQLLQEPGESAIVTEEAGLNVCFDGRINTTIVAESSAPDTANCQGSEDYSILVEVECRIDVDIVCMTEAGEPCSTIEVPVGLCTEGGNPIQTLRLRYENRACDAGENNSQGAASFCNDLNTPTDRVQIVCTTVDPADVSVTTTVESGLSDVGEGETILLTSDGSSLPVAVSCEVQSSLDPAVIYQVVTFETSGSIDLSLQDQFGSLQVDACSTESGSLDCQTTVCIEYYIKNVGTHDVDVIDLTRTLGDETIQLLDMLPDTNLTIGETSEAIEKVVIDTCRAERTCVSAIVQASGENQLVCDDEDEVCFGGIDCDIGIEMACQTVDEGFSGSCNDLKGEQYLQCVCGECPAELKFKYTASTCPETPVPGLLSCVDENPLPEEDAFIVVSSMGNELFRGSIDRGAEITIADGGNCLPSELMILISAGESAASSQVLTIDTSCSDSGITLLEELGAFQFSGYTCARDAIPHNCFVNADFEIVATNIGPVAQEVTMFTFTFDGETTDLLFGVRPRFRELDTSESLTLTASEILDRCSGSSYLASSTVQGNDGDCEAIADILIGPIEPGSPSPTAVPAEVPTSAPTPSDDSPMPGTPSPGTPSPTSATDPPSIAPDPPTVAPTVVPDPPTQAPVDAVTPTPTISECILNVSTTCTPPPGSESCEAIRTEPVQCESRPESMILLFEGGDCDNSFNAQSGPLFQCQDFDGGAPTQAGTPVYIVVTDIRGAGVVFFNDWAEVGDLITLVHPDPDGGVLEADQNITIYESNETSPESIIQTVTFHTSCSENPSADSLFLKDRFGSMQVVGFNNVDQGEVSCFTRAIIGASVSVEPFVGGQPITLTSIISRYSQVPGGEDGLTNFTSEVEGIQITSDSEPYDVSLSLDLDLTARRTYNVFTTVTGTAEDGKECTGSDLLQFAAGQPPPPLFPTIAPTQRPTHSIQPTPDPEDTPCTLTAVVTCLVKSGGSNTCVGLQHPSDVTCTGNMSPSSLKFQYTGDRCPVNQQNYRCADTDLNMGAARESVFVEAKDGENVIDFGSVRLNDFITLAGDYGAETLITLYTVVEGLRGEPLQVLNIPTGCDPDDDLTLLNQYGALELTSFTNAASGEQGIEAQIQIIYAVENSGFQLTTVERALMIDAFEGGPIDLIEEPTNLGPGELIILFSNEQILNLRLKEQLGRVDTFFLSVTGSAVSNDLECQDTAQLSF